MVIGLLWLAFDLNPSCLRGGGQDDRPGRKRFCDLD
jgi:hypothetical protein